MDPVPTVDPFEALRNLTLEQVEERLSALDAERASLSLLRRSLVARKKYERRHASVKVKDAKTS